MTEILIKSIPGYEGYYSATTDGRIYSDRKGRYLKGTPTSGGYIVVELWINQVKRWAKVDWLVLETFVGPRPPGLMSLHGDDDKTNNELSNLEWGTAKKNMQQAVSNGIKMGGTGDNHRNSKLNSDLVTWLRQKHAAGGISYYELADEVSATLGFKVSWCIVRKAVLRETWKHVP